MKTRLPCRLARRSTLLLALLSFLTFQLSTVLAADVREWSGSASMDNKWMTSDNWFGNSVPNPGDYLLFRTAQRHPNNQNNFPDDTTFQEIELRGGGPGMGYNIDGNRIALNSGIRVENNNGVSIDHTINNALLLNSNQTFTVQNDVGLFSLNGALDLNGKVLTFDVTSGSQAQVSGVISGTGGLLKNGPGLLLLTGNNTYPGATRVRGGTLQINGSQPASTVLLTTGTLKGNGTVGILVGDGSGMLSPGGSPGILTCSNVALNASTTFIVELNGATPGGGYDQLNVRGSVSLNNAVLSVTLGFTPAIGTSFTILNNDGADAVSGTFNGLPRGAIFAAGGTQFQVNYAGGDGNDVVLTRIVALEVERVSTNAVRVLWPTNGAAGFNLESNTNLATSDWELVSPPPTIVGARNVVTNTFPPAHKFYRLRKP